MSLIVRSLRVSPFINTQERHIMKYDQAMKWNEWAWKCEECYRMSLMKNRTWPFETHTVFKVVLPIGEAGRLIASRLSEFLITSTSSSSRLLPLLVIWLTTANIQKVGFQKSTIMEETWCSTSYFVVQCDLNGRGRQQQVDHTRSLLLKDIENLLRNDSSISLQKVPLGWLEQESLREQLRRHWSVVCASRSTQRNAPRATVNQQLSCWPLREERCSLFASLPVLSQWARMQTYTPTNHALL